MSISIQSPTATQLAILESLTSQSGASAGAGASSGAGATSLLNATTPSASSNSVIDLVGGSTATSGVSAGLATSASIADAAVSAGTTIEGLLAKMKSDAVSASNPSLDDSARSTLNTDFKANLAQIQKAVASAGVDGVNLLDGSVNGSANVSAATLTGINLSVGGPLIGVAADASLTDPASASTIASQVSGAIENVGKAVGQISAQGQAIETHLSLVAQAGFSASSSINGSLDADGARLAALQVQQQLSLTNGAVANQSPNAILALFQSS